MMKTDETVATEDRANPEIAELSGEAAGQLVTGADDHLQEMAPSPWTHVPGAAEGGVTYYDRPLLKRPVWTIDVPLYYFLGGSAGAALTLGAALQLVSRERRRDLRSLSAACHWIGIIGSTAGAGFLVHDLGRPSRFLYMMRVFRPTSPMNMGVWILSGAAPAAIATGFLANRRGLPGEIGRITGYVSGIFGAALAGYTGVLVGNTAIPIWQETRRWLPVLFIASSAASAASIIDVVIDDERARRLTLFFGTAGRIAEIVAAQKTEQAASSVPRVAEPFHSGATGLLWKAAGALTLGSLGLSLVGRKSRKARFAAGLLGAAGSLCLRFAVHYLSEASTRDPHALFDQQRAK